MWFCTTATAGTRYLAVVTMTARLVLAVLYIIASVAGSARALVPAWTAWAGDFRVSWNASAESLVVAGSTAHPIWASVPGQPFLMASAATFAAPEFEGMYSVNLSTAWTTAGLCVTAVDNGTRPDTAVVSGMLCLGQCVCAPELGTVHQQPVWGFTLSFTSQSAHELRFNASVHTANAAGAGGVNPNALSLQYASMEDEAIFGMGASYTHVNMKGLKVPVLTSEQGVGRGLQPVTFVLNEFKHGAGGDWHTTYSPVPHYVSSYNTSLFLTNTQYSVFDFGALGNTSIIVQVVHTTTPVDSTCVWMSGGVLQAPSPLQVHCGALAVRGRGGGRSLMLIASASPNGRSSRRTPTTPGACRRCLIGWVAAARLWAWREAPLPSVPTSPS